MYQRREQAAYDACTVHIAGHHSVRMVNYREPFNSGARIRQMQKFNFDADDIVLNATASHIQHTHHSHCMVSNHGTIITVIRPLFGTYSSANDYTTHFTPSRREKKHNRPTQGIKWMNTEQNKQKYVISKPKCYKKSCCCSAILATIIYCQHKLKKKMRRKKFTRIYIRKKQLQSQILTRQ